MNWVVHPLADAWPMLRGPELQMLADDIAEHGIREPVVIYEGMVLDGRNRLMAAQMACVQVEAIPTREFEGDDPASFIRSMNHQRRHLSVRERQAALRRLEALENERRGGDPQALPSRTSGVTDARPGSRNLEHEPYSSRVSIARDAGGTEFTVTEIDKEAKEMLQSGEAKTSSEAYGKTAIPPKKRGRSMRGRNRQGKTKTNPNPAVEADKRYSRLEHVIQRCILDYGDSLVKENASWVARRLSDQAWSRDVRPDVFKAAQCLMALAEAVDASYVQPSPAAGESEEGANV